MKAEYPHGSESEAAWKAFALEQSKSDPTYKSYTYRGQRPDQPSALILAGLGGFVEPWPLDGEQGNEEGFPKSFQVFNGPRPGQESSSEDVLRAVGPAGREQAVGLRRDHTRRPQAGKRAPLVRELIASGVGAGVRTALVPSRDDLAKRLVAEKWPVGGAPYSLFDAAGWLLEIADTFARYARHTDGCLRRRRGSECDCGLDEVRTRYWGSEIAWPPSL